MTDASKPDDKSAAETGKTTTAGKRAAETSDADDKQRRRPAGESVRAGLNKLRSRLASLVWLVAVVCALFLAVGALLVALKMNQDNAIVSFVLEGAEALDLGTFKEFDGKNAEVQSALTNWGIAAVIYLVVGKVLDKIIRP